MKSCGQSRLTSSSECTGRTEAWGWVTGNYIPQRDRRSLTAATHGAALSGVAGPSSLGNGPPSASCLDVPVTLAGKEHAVLGSPGCPFVPRQRWGAVALATSPFPLKQSLEVRIEGTLCLGVWPWRVSPVPRGGGQRRALPPAGPGCSELKCPGPCGRPGHPLGTGMPEVAAAGGRTFPEGGRRHGARRWAPPVLCPLSCSWCGGFFGSWRGGVILGGGRTQDRKQRPAPPPRAGSGVVPAVFSRWSTCPSGHHRPPHRKCSQRPSRPVWPPESGAQRGGSPWGGCRGLLW